MQCEQIGFILDIFQFNTRIKRIKIIHVCVSHRDSEYSQQLYALYMNSTWEREREREREREIFFQKLYPQNIKLIVTLKHQHKIPIHEISGQISQLSAISEQQLPTIAITLTIFNL